MTAATGRHADPVEDYLTALAAGLHGPARVKARMLSELRDGLVDATAAQISDGEPYQHAARRAVREFGTADELIPGCQQELTIAQTRHTARVLTLTATLLIGCWHLIWITNDGRAGEGLPRIVAVLSANLAGLVAAAALLAATTLAATGLLARWLPTPRRLPLAVAWAGTLTSAAMAVSTLMLAAASAFTTSWLLTVVGGALAAASHAVLAASARACRHCARRQTLDTAR